MASIETFKQKWIDNGGHHPTTNFENLKVMVYRGNELQKKRSKLVERNFDHTCETGGARRTWQRGTEKVTKRYKLVASRGQRM